MRVALHAAFGSDSDSDSDAEPSVERHAVVAGLAVVRRWLPAPDQAALLRAVLDAGWLPALPSSSLGQQPLQAHRFGSFPPWLRLLADAVERTAAQHCGLLPATTTASLDQAIVNAYGPGAALASHVDLAAFADGVACVSLLGPATMTFSRPGFDAQAVALAPGDLLTLRGDARWAWAHGIAAVPAPRVSITLRRLARVPHELTCPA